MNKIKFFMLQSLERAVLFYQLKSTNKKRQPEGCLYEIQLESESIT